MKFGFLAE